MSINGKIHSKKESITQHVQFTHNSPFTDKNESSLNFIYLCLRGFLARGNAASMKVIINKVSERALITS